MPVTSLFCSRASLTHNVVSGQIHFPCTLRPESLPWPENSPSMEPSVKSLLMTFPSIGLSLCVRSQSCHTSSWHSVVLVIGSVRCFSPHLLSVSSCSYQLGWVLWKIAVAKQSWKYKTYSGSIPIKGKGERGQAETRFSLQVMLIWHLWKEKGKM